MTTTNHILFEDYLRGTLVGDEKSKLEVLLSNSANEKEEFELYEKMRRTLSPHISNPSKESDLKEHLEKLSKEYTPIFEGENQFVEKKSIEKKRPIFIRRIMGMAASFTFLIAALAGTSFYANSNYSPQALAHTSFEAPKYISGDKSSQDFSTSENTYIAAIEAFERKDYQTSINIALSLKSVEELSIREDAEWLIVINSLALNNNLKAKNMLIAIADDPRHSYTENAKRLNGKFDSFFFKLGQLF